MGNFQSSKQPEKDLEKEKQQQLEQEQEQSVEEYVDCSCLKPSSLSSPNTSAEGTEEEGEHDGKQGTDTEEDSSTTSLSSKEENVPSSLPIGKRTVFGYSRGFHEKYKEGKVLGRGQFGCTHSATVLASNEVVAVKKINRMKVLFFLPYVN